MQDDKEGQKWMEWIILLKAIVLVMIEEAFGAEGDLLIKVLKLIWGMV